MTTIFVTTGTSFMSAKGVLVPGRRGFDPTDDRGEGADWESQDAHEYAERHGADISQRLGQNLAKGELGRCLTAELASLRALFRERPALNQADTRLIFIASDTFSCECAARWNAAAAGTFWKAQAEAVRVKGLSVKDRTRFVDVGLGALAKLVRENLGDATPIFNVTGGYKGVIPCVALMAWECKAEICYLFDNEQEDKGLILWRLSDQLPWLGALAVPGA